MQTRFLSLRFIAALLPPFLALALQWLLWPFIKPFVWFFFFPAVFFSARIGGISGGLVGTFISTLCVWYFFIPPQLSWEIENVTNIWSMGLFLVMGYLFSESHERLRRANRMAAEAFEEVRTAKDEITHLYERTRELDELKTQFFANISHELRTPLALILGPVSRRLSAGRRDDEDRRDLEIVERNARLLYRHVTDLLDVAKVEAGRMEMNYADVDLARLARFVASHFDALAGERSVRFELELPDSLPARVDREKCQRVLLNLLSNAFKFTPTGGKVILALERDGGSARMRVADSGPGVPEALREVIFEPFRQGEGGAERRFGGTGLGLAIVREFVELHGGHVGVEQAPGGGALFSVVLPLVAPGGSMVQPDAPFPDEAMDWQLVDELRPPTCAAAHQGRDAAGKPMVLVVEDNRDMGAFLVEVLGEKYRIAVAHDGQDGLDQALVLGPDLILSDVMMPSLSGERMVEELRRQHETAGIPVVMLTAKADDELRLQLLRAGVHDVIYKPFLPGELLAKVDLIIAERRQAAEDLRRSEERFRVTFEQAAVGIAHVAPDGHWLRVNQKLCEIVGYSREELLSRSFQDITHPNDLGKDLAYLQQMLRGETQTYSTEKRYIRGDGRPVWINLTVALVRDALGAPDYFISVIEDIERRKVAEQELKDSEAQYRSVVETSSDGFWVVGEDGSLVEVNDSYVRRSGFSREELLAMRVSDLDVDEEPEQTASRLARMRRNGHDHFESRHRAKDGQVWPVEVVTAYLPIGKGKFFGFIRDISERREADAERNELRAEMEDLLQLHVARQTAAALAHDLNQPLISISAYTEAALRLLNSGNPKPDKLLHALQGSAKEAQRAGTVVRQLLGFLHKTQANVEAIDLNRLVEEALVVGREAGLPVSSIHLELDPALPPVVANRLQIQRVVSNLLHNSAEAMRGMPEGTASIEIRTWSEGGAAGVTVHDNGPGLQGPVAEHVFEPFYTTKQTGIGMGLAISRTLIEANGGRLWHDAATQGATFHFLLPLTQ